MVYLFVIDEIRIGNASFCFLFIGVSLRIFVNKKVSVFIWVLFLYILFIYKIGSGWVCILWNMILFVFAGCYFFFAVVLF